MTTTTPPTAGYLLDNSGSQVADRWAALSALYDEPTFRRFREVGIRPGWRCLDVGAGGGSVASWLAAEIGSSGTVTATDLDTRWLDRLSDPNLTVLRHDITVDRLPELTYDLIHCRLVLTHLPDPVPVIDQLVRALRPRGWLVLEEFDLGLLSGACQRPRTEAEHRANRIREAFAGLIAQRGADLRLGSKLADLLADRGFDAIDVRGSFESGPAVRQLERANLEQVRDALLAGGISAEELDAHLSELGRLPLLLLPVMISTVARKWST